MVLKEKWQKVVDVLLYAYISEFSVSKGQMMELECVSFATSESCSHFGVGITEDFATESLPHMQNEIHERAYSKFSK